MSGIPLSHKARTLTVSTFLPPAPTVHHHHSATFPLPAPVETRTVTSTVIKKSNVQLDGALNDIKRRYEGEARQVQQNYEVDYHNHVSLIRTVEELEALLEEERRRTYELETKYNGVVIELEKERRLRVDFEHENSVLREELRRAEGIISDAELKITRLQQDNSHLDSENKSLRNEIHRLTDLYNSRLRDIEEKYLMQVRDLTGEVERLRTQLEQQRLDFENRLRDLDRDWYNKYGRIEEVLRDKERLVAELEAELRKLTDHITQLKIEYEEELRRQVIIVREEEQHKFQIALKNLEARLQHVESERDMLHRKNQDLARELHIKERQIQDLRAHYESEIARLKQEVHDLRNQIGILNNANEKLRADLAAREITISRLESEIVNLERELNRLKEIHAQEINRLVNDHNNEKRRWEDTERILKARIAEIERIVRALESENGKLRADIERIKEQVTGNVHRTIFQTFVDYDTTSPNVKSLY